MRLLIGARCFRVIAMSDEERDSGDAMGVTHKERGVISIWPGLPPDLQAETLLHEIIHAASFAYGLRFPSKEEPVANTLGAALAQVIRDNPQVVEAVQAAQQRGEPIVSVA